MIPQYYPGIPHVPTIFNMVVDTVICYWVMVVTATEAGAELLVVFTQDLVAYFYNDYGLIASTQPERLKREFNALQTSLTGLSSGKIHVRWLL